MGRSVWELSNVADKVVLFLIAIREREKNSRAQSAVRVVCATLRGDSSTICIYIHALPLPGASALDPSFVAGEGA